MKYKRITLLSIYCALSVVIAVRAIFILHKPTFLQICSVVGVVIFLYQLVMAIRQNFILNKSLSADKPIPVTYPRGLSQLD